MPSAAVGGAILNIGLYSVALAAAAVVVQEEEQEAKLLLG